mmetsp:Transcript_89114/g.177231  ORF Transcript_89114/g.177231 Transcript_89114/m.177231 type:complete len:91 (-) Transcript_89114:71-343(-)
MGDTTKAPVVIENKESDTVFGLPIWMFASIVGISAFLCCLIPLFWWLKRQANLRKPYIPSEPPDINGFVQEVVDKAAASGHLKQSRLGRS